MIKKLECTLILSIHTYLILQVLRQTILTEIYTRSIISYNATIYIMINSWLSWSFFIIFINLNIRLFKGKSLEMLFAFLSFSYRTFHIHMPATPFLEPVTV